MTTHPLPESLGQLLDEVGLDAHITVQRKDGKPLDSNDLAALGAIVLGYEAEHGGPVSDDEAMAAAAEALGLSSPGKAAE
jgi:hypothetical protein